MKMKPWPISLPLYFYRLVFSVVFVFLGMRCDPIIVFFGWRYSIVILFKPVIFHCDFIFRLIMAVLKVNYHQKYCIRIQSPERKRDERKKLMMKRTRIVMNKVMRMSKRRSLQKEMRRKRS